MEDYNPRNPRMLVNWFNLEDRQHQEAYMYLREHGMWPPSFVDLIDADNVIFHECWQTMLEARMAWTFIHERLGMEA